MNKQEIFNTVVTHLAKQGWQRSTGEGPFKETCVYRGPNGRKCAAGALIKDAFYTPDLETNEVYGSDVTDALMKSGVPEGEIPFVQRCQWVHDSGRNPGLMQSEFKALATVHRLEFPDV